MNSATGSKYEATKSMDLAQVAKLLREDIKAAIKAGKLPASIKTSVTIERYAGGQSLNVRVKSYDGPLFNEHYLEYLKGDQRERFVWFKVEDGIGHATFTRLTEELENAVETLKDLQQAYNYDRSDIQTDYHNRRFYGDVSVCWKLERASKSEAA